MRRFFPLFLLLAATPLAAQDVKPTDWAMQTLGRLVNRYGCTAGYPAGTYRSNRPQSRYEFAASLKACVEHINGGILASQGPNGPDADDLRTLQRDFAPELAMVQGRVDNLAAKTSALEATQFSTTAKLAQPGGTGTPPQKILKRKRKPSAVTGAAPAVPAPSGP